MIYLIASIAGKIDKNSALDTKIILKIGYTNDERFDIRLSQYKLHNPGGHCVLHTIPGGTLEHEKALHYKFSKFRFSDYGKEWFEYSEDIIDFIKKSTIDSLTELYDSSPIMVRKMSNVRISQCIRACLEIDQRRDIPQFNEVYRYYYLEVVNHPKYYITEEDIWKFFKITEEEMGPVLVYMNRDFSNFSEKVQKFLDEFDNLTRFPDKMKLLCDTEFSESELDVVFKQVPLEFSKYYNYFGSEKIKSMSYLKYNMESAYNKRTYDGGEQLDELVYLEFKEGNKLSSIDIKSKLIPIYNKVNHPNAPHALDIKKYFETKDCEIFIDKKRNKGYKLIKRLR